MNLKEEFSEVSPERWKVQLEKDLKGISFDQLCREDENGINVLPFYTNENLKQEAKTDFTHFDWDICSYQSQLNDTEQNKTALLHLNQGANAIFLNVNSTTNPEKLICNIHANYIKIHYSFQEKNIDFLNQLHNYFESQKTDLSELQGSIILDPISLLIRGYDEGFELRQKYWKTITEHPLLKKSNLSPFVTDAYIYQNAGCNTVHELAFTLAQLNEQLNFIQENKISTANKKIVLITSSSINFFQNLCKLKALRNLSTFLLREYRMENEIFIHANTTLLNKTAKDQYNNLVRSTIEAMSAVGGGVNSISITPYNYITKNEDTNAQRLAINQMQIFKEEAFLSKVADAGAGSFYIESYCENLEEKVWEEFKKIEEQGGLIQLFKEGKLKKMIEGDAEKLKTEYVSGKRILTGVNKFENTKEKELQRIFPHRNNSKGLSFQSIEEWLTEIKIQHA